MASHVWHALASRVTIGHGLWSFAAFFFPTLAIVKDQSVALAMLLFVTETLCASALLAVRVQISKGAFSREDGACRRLHEVGKALLYLVAPFGLGCGLMLAGVTFIEVQNGRSTFDVLLFLDRARWMVVMLLASAVLDSLIAPVRSVHWLETGVAWQGSRTAVLFLCLLLGWPVMLWSGTTQSFFWIFFALRLLTDLGSLKPTERERIRTNMFGDAYTAAPNA